MSFDWKDLQNDLIINNTVVGWLLSSIPPCLLFTQHHLIHRTRTNYHFLLIKKETLKIAQRDHLSNRLSKPQLYPNPLYLRQREEQQVREFRRTEFDDAEKDDV